MIRILAPAMLALAPVAAQAGEPPALSLEQQTALRCSAAFAIVSTLQGHGGAQEYPPLGERGREYFVRASARIMDEAGLDRPAISAALQAEAEGLANTPGRLEQVMPSCLALLDLSGV